MVKEKKMNEEKVIYLLHLARKAGKLKMGFDASKNSCENGVAKLLIIAENLSKNTKKKIMEIAYAYNVKAIKILSKKKFSESFNVRELGIICVEDTNFSNGIKNLV